MEKVVNDVFILNGMIELFGGLLGLVIPRFFFASSDKRPYNKSAAIWWAFAAISLGVVSLSISKVSDTEVGKHLSAIGFLIYHVGLAIAHTGVVDSDRSSIMKFGGLIAHLSLSAIFAKYSLDHDAFNTAYIILEKEFYNARAALEPLWS